MKFGMAIAGLLLLLGGVFATFGHSLGLNCGDATAFSLLVDDDYHVDGEDNTVCVPERNAILGASGVAGIAGIGLLVTGAVHAVRTRH